ncbi:MAG: ABC transporter permease [Desulforhabdus sp.]|nr:ABC transporter permease [Desulforhabdus sp.]
MHTNTAKTIIRPASGKFRLNWEELSEYRDLLYFLVWRDIKVRYKQTVIGGLWAVLQPLFPMVVFSLIFGRFAHLPSEGIPYPLFTFAALLPWQLFAYALSQSSESLVANEKLISKVYFPRILIPLTPVFSGLLDFAISFTVFLVIMLFYGSHPGANIIFLPLFVTLAVITSLGAGLWLTALNVKYRDVRYTIPFLTQVWLYLTPVAYSAVLIPENWRFLYGLNPMVGVVEAFRWVLLAKQPPSLAMVFISAVMAFGLLYSGLVYFQKMEDEFADII